MSIIKPAKTILVKAANKFGPVKSMIIAMSGITCAGIGSIAAALFVPNDPDDMFVIENCEFEENEKEIEI